MSAPIPTLYAGGAPPTLDTAQEERETVSHPTGGDLNDSTHTSTSSTPSTANNNDNEEHVSVSRAEKQFQDLSRQLSHSSSLHRTLTGNRDPEKGSRSKESGSDDVSEDEFDLLSYLKGDLDERDAAGIKRKSLGVVWKDLKVIGAGGMKVSVQSFYGRLY